MAKISRQKTITEDEFKATVAVLIESGIYPTSTTIFGQLGRAHITALTSRQLKWRREVCVGLGFELMGDNLIFDRADGKAPCVECGEFLLDHRRVDCHTMILYENCLGEYFKL